MGGACSQHGREEQCKVLVRTPERKSPLRRHTCRWDKIKKEFREIRYCTRCAMNIFALDQEPVPGSCGHKMRRPHVRLLASKERLPRVELFLHAVCGLCRGAAIVHETPSLTLRLWLQPALNQHQEGKCIRQTVSRRVITRIIGPAIAHKVHFRLNVTQCLVLLV